MTQASRLTAAGFAATAVAFGPARMGFGLFLPVFQEEFSLPAASAGMIASGGFLAFLLALLASAWLCERFGERVSVMAGAAAATAGFAAVAVGTAGFLTAGIASAGASAGLCWAPFNDAAERMVPEEGRPGALSVVSTGTSFGVITAAVLALAVTLNLLDWRTAWIGFGLCGLALIAIAHGGLPPRRPRANPASRAEAGENGQTAPRIPVPPAAMAGRLLSLAQRAALPLYGAALCFGMTNAIFLSFAADRVVDAGGLPGLPDGTASAAIFLAYGICGLLGLLTGRIEARIGLALLLCGIFAAGALSLILIALAPSSWIAVLLAASVHGVAIMMVSAVLSFWSLWLFPGSGTLAFTAALVCVAAGSVLGPAVAGLLAAAYGHLAMFLAAAIPPLAMSAWFANLLRHPRPRLTPAVKGA